MFPRRKNSLSATPDTQVPFPESPVPEWLQKAIGHHSARSPTWKIKLNDMSEKKLKPLAQLVDFRWLHGRGLRPGPRRCPPSWNAGRSRQHLQQPEEFPYRASWRRTRNSRAISRAGMRPGRRRKKRISVSSICLRTFRTSSRNTTWSSFGQATLSPWDYNSPRGHFHALEDHREILRAGFPTELYDGSNQPGTYWTCKGRCVPRLMGSRPG